MYKTDPQKPQSRKTDYCYGSDVQPERRVPSKPSSKKIATKGGKQPRKHLLHK